MIDRWREILEILWRRRLRTALTALSVAWGIFMLVLLLAAGQGLSNGAKAEFSRNASNSVYVFPGRMSKPHQGNPVGKPVQLYNDDHRLVERSVPVELTSARADVGPTVLRRGEQSGSFVVKSCLPDNDIIEKSEVVLGRFISWADHNGRRKVAILGTKVRDTLFGKDADPIGQDVQIGRFTFKVAGVFFEDLEQAEQETVYLPPGDCATAVGAGREAGPGRVPRRSDPGAVNRKRDRRGAGAAGRAARVLHRGQAGGFHVEFGRDVPAVPGAVPRDQQLHLADRPGDNPGGGGGGQQHHADLGAGTPREIGVRKAVGAPPSAIVR